ncbi:MAG: MBOAT family protein, partial [Clostridia bacterium]|nr:MBOAT family protein [Clostridia bacterium]
RSATEFWRRWHISLGTFFRDYVYIPLGGNRRAHIRNIIVVWFLTGLWHGASWNFVLWGLFYCALLIFEKKFFLSFMERINPIVSEIISRVYVAFITVFGFALFYFTDNTAKSIGYLFGIGVDGFSDIFVRSLFMGNLNLLLAGIIFAVPTVPFIVNLFRSRFKVSYEARRYVMTAVSIALLLLSTVRMIGDTYSPFLYWNF